MNCLVCIVIGYLLGSISPAYILGRIRGIDIRETGSRNAGASNVKVNFGWTAGILTALFDIFKSFLSAYIGAKLFPDLGLAKYLGGLGAILGHIFPFYMGFRGGKGFASYMGLLLALNWKYFLVMVVYTALATLVTNYIVIGTFGTIITTPIVFYFYYKAGFPATGILVLIALLIIYKHRINIIRLMNHEEIGLRQKDKV